MIIIRVFLILGESLQHGLIVEAMLLEELLGSGEVSESPLELHQQELDQLILRLVCVKSLLALLLVAFYCLL